MDVSTAQRLNDPEFKKTFSKIVKDYLRLGTDALDYWLDEYDTSHDVMMTYASLTRQDFDALSKGHPRRFILPMTATQITTMGTYIAQVLYGQQTPHKVIGRGSDDAVAAEHMNTLLAWNAEQDSTYFLGYHFIMDTLTYNRGVFLNTWEPLYENEVTLQQKTIEGQINQDGTPATYLQPQHEQVPAGGYCKSFLISPYDWVVDPSFPLHRMQEGRFTGHRLLTPWVELKKRSELPSEHPQYVLPSAVMELKAKKRPAATTTVKPTGAPAGRPDSRVSRTAYERSRSQSPTGSERADHKDAGVVECHEMWVKLVPKDYGISDSTTPTIFQILVGQTDVVLSVNISTYAHGQFPYSAAEARPSAYYQYSPSWVMILKGIQDYIDWLKNRHQDALSRTIGNVFIADPSRVDLDDFLNPEKEGLIIPLKPEAHGTNIRDIIQQVPIKDMTQNFNVEVSEFIQYAESVTGANSSMQGSLEGETSATEYSGTQQMAAGRMSSIARLLSSLALVPQTRQFVSNFQQFLTEEQAVRFNPENRQTLPPELKGADHLVVSRDTIQGRFDMVAHDGTLAGPDGKKVAAITRLIETATAIPDVFMPAPGNINIRKLILEGAKSAGLKIEDYLYTDAMLDSMGQGGGPPPPPELPQEGGGPQVQQPGGQNPGPQPINPQLPQAVNPMDAMKTVDAAQPRPGNQMIG